MKSKLVILLFLIAGWGGVFAQQLPLYSQYMHNPFILNPAVAGTYHYFQARLMSRLQWIGFPDAPVTNSLSVFGPVSGKNKDMGYGVTLYSDITSPTSRLGLKGAYAYNIALNDHVRMSFAAALGFFQFKYDGTNLQMYAPDPVAPKAVKSEFEPDGMLGVLVYSGLFQVGVSVDNLFNNKFNVNPDQTEVKSFGKLLRHYYLLGSYNWIHNRRWTTECSAVIKAVEGFNVPVQFDINVREWYRNTAWFGMSYRSLDAVALLVGYIFNKRIYAGYAFDFNLSAIRAYNFGSHEIMLGYRFNTLK
ncbi:MAG: type IX secretion system membrane protein PorP/SprF [Bacteroidales bacterium]|nr:type IX secretion system membrane protein PorP/SprF [Bacteroidales bacterium]